MTPTIGFGEMLALVLDGQAVITARPPRRLCRCCGERASNRPRTLCWRCYYTPGVLERFPSTSKFARKGVADRNGADRSLGDPTEAAPLTSAKIVVMAERAAAGLPLFHPLDNAVPNEETRAAVRGVCRTASVFAEVA